MSDYYTEEVLAQPRCVRCNTFMAWDGRACARCGWPEIYDEAGNVTRPWPEHVSKRACDCNDRLCPTLAREKAAQEAAEKWLAHLGITSHRDRDSLAAAFLEFADRELEG